MCVEYRNRQFVARLTDYRPINYSLYPIIYLTTHDYLTGLDVPIGPNARRPSLGIPDLLQKIIASTCHVHVQYLWASYNSYRGGRSGYLSASCPGITSDSL